MDLGLPGTSGIEATKRVCAASPGTKVLVLTVHDDVAYLRKAFDAGARGYLVKEAADVELVLAVRHVAAGEEYVHPSLGAALLTPGASGARAAGPGGELSDRELEVLRLVALGHTNAEIAAQLYVSIRTVETHRAHLQQKLGVKGRADLAHRAREIGLLDDGPRP
jgi:DNA-binding NarL/FixJ family response regulator